MRHSSSTGLVQRPLPSMRAWASRRSRTMPVVSKSAGRAGGGFLSVEGVDLGADCFVFVGDDTVGDAGVGEGHVHGAVTEQRCDGFEAHPAVETGGLGYSNRPERVRGDGRAGGCWPRSAVIG